MPWTSINEPIVILRRSRITSNCCFLIDGLNNFFIFKNEGETISAEADEDSVLFVISGEPINEPIAAYGPFLMNTHEELELALEDFNKGKFGYLED